MQDNFEFPLCLREERVLMLIILLMISNMNLEELTHKIQGEGFGREGNGLMNRQFDLFRSHLFSLFSFSSSSNQHMTSSPPFPFSSFFPLLSFSCLLSKVITALVSLILFTICTTNIKQLECQ